MFEMAQPDRLQAPRPEREFIVAVKVDDESLLALSREARAVVAICPEAAILIM